MERGGPDRLAFKERGTARRRRDYCKVAKVQKPDPPPKKKNLFFIPLCALLLPFSFSLSLLRCGCFNLFSPKKQDAKKA